MLMSEESESTKDIRRAVCCQLAEALMHSNRYVSQIFRQITTLSFDESQFDDFFFLLIKFIVMPNMPNQIFWKCPQHLLQDEALPKRDCLARVLGGPNAPT